MTIQYMYQFSPWNCQLYILRIFFSIFFVVIHQNHNVSLICVRCDPLHDIGIQDPQLLQGRFQGRIQRVFQGGRGGKNLGPNGDGVLGRKIFDFLTSPDAFSGHFLTIFGLWGLAQGGGVAPPALNTPLNVLSAYN